MTAHLTFSVLPFVSNTVPAPVQYPARSSIGPADAAPTVAMVPPPPKSNAAACFFMLPLRQSSLRLCAPGNTASPATVKQGSCEIVPSHRSSCIDKPEGGVVVPPASPRRWLRPQARLTAGGLP